MPQASLEIMPTIKVPVKCKVCHGDFQAEVDQEYDHLRDRRGLLPLFTCNSCYDYVFGTKSVISGLNRTVISLTEARRSQSGERLQDTEANCRKALEALCQRYGKLLAAHLRGPYWFSPEFPEQMFENPDKIGLILAHYKRTYEREIVTRQTHPQNLAG